MKKRLRLLAALLAACALLTACGGGSAPAGEEQISLGDLGSQTVLKKLRMTDVNILSPIEALNLLAELKQDLNG